MEAEVGAQLDLIRMLGVNTISFELRAADDIEFAPFTPPQCTMTRPLGLLYPQPTPAELSNLVAFLDLVQSKGLRVFLRLVNTHMEEQPATGNATWLRAILAAAGSHPALDLVLFEGDTRLVDADGNGSRESCGIPAEPPLWLGAGAEPGRYVKWAISFAHSLGLPYRMLSAEAIVGDFFLESQPPAGPDAIDRHLWSPIAVLKTILDELAVPAEQRTYAISLLEHRKCQTARSLACVDKDPHAWADETLGYVRTVVGASGGRIVAPEMGLWTPREAGWSTSEALSSLIELMAKHGVDGGSFWRWTSFTDQEDADPTLAEPIKRRGSPGTYTVVRDALARLYGGTTHRLTVTMSGVPGGSVTSSVPGISCGTRCSEDYAVGTQVTLTAIAASQFDGWSGGGCSGTGSCTVTMDAAKSVTAMFSWRPTAATVCASGCTRTTIQTALDAATPGDTVLVRSTYDSIAAGEVFPVTTQAIRSINPAGVIRILGEVDGSGSPITRVKVRTVFATPGVPAPGFDIVSPGAVENLVFSGSGEPVPAGFGPGGVPRVVVAEAGLGTGASCKLKGGLTLKNLSIDFRDPVSPWADNGLDVRADDVVIEKVSFIGISDKALLVDGDNVRIQNNTFDGRNGSAVRGYTAIGFGGAAFTGSRDLTVRGFACNGAPLANVVSGNTITGYLYGILWCSGSGNRIQENTVSGTTLTGILGERSQATQVLGNQVTPAGGSGIALGRVLLVPAQTCHGNKVAQNKVLGPSTRDLQLGITVKGCTDTEVILNEVRDTADNSGSIYVSLSQGGAGATGAATTTVIQGNTVIGGNGPGIVYLGSDTGSTAVDRSVIRDNVVTDHKRDGIVVRYMKWPRSGIGAGNVVAYNTVRHVNLGGFADSHGMNLQDLSGTAFDRNTALDTQAGFGFFLANSTGVNGNCNTGAANAAGLFGQSNVTPVYGNVNVNCRIALYTHYDFDGDAKSDVAVYRHSTGDWLIRRSSGAGDTSLSWGSPALDDIPAPANYTQAGKTDVAVYRFSTGDWVIKRSTDGGLTQVKFGEPFVGDIPVPADYDGDGLADLATFRVSTANAEWRVRRSSDGQTQYFAWGCAACADLAVPGDYDGDGKADVAVYRRSTGEWFIRRSSNGSLLQLRWGSPELGDLPVAGRYTTSAMTDVAVYRSLTGDWLIRRSTDAGLTQVVWGSPSTGDFPVPADYSQANVTDIATFRPSDGLWRIRRSPDFQAINYNFGNPALLDAPLTSR